MRLDRRRAAGSGAVSAGSGRLLRVLKTPLHHRPDHEEQRGQAENQRRPPDRQVLLTSSARGAAIERRLGHRLAMASSNATFSTVI